VPHHARLLLANDTRALRGATGFSPADDRRNLGCVFSMNNEVDLERLRLAYKSVCAELMADRATDGHWPGQMSSSPVATAAAVSALVVAHRDDAKAALRDSVSAEVEVGELLIQGELSELLVESLHWLARCQNADGGWGDCPGNRSNLAATVLVQAAFRLTGIPAKYADLMARADDYVEKEGGADSLRGFGKDRLMAAPILVNCALAGMVPWRLVPALPFEHVCFPHYWQRVLRITFAPQAVPALVAAGYAKYYHDPPHNPISRLIRHATWTKSLTLLERLQAEDGGFLDTTPLTAFVVMTLASSGCQELPLVQHGVEFLLSSVRPDASWSIHSNLAVRDTALAVEALAAESPAPLLAIPAAATHSLPWAETARIGDQSTQAVSEAPLRRPDADASHVVEPPSVLNNAGIDWLLDCQHTHGSLVDGGSPGGWGGSDAAGADPNVEDTAAVLLALTSARRDVAGPLRRERLDRAARLGVGWLLERQNADGGWPAQSGGLLFASCGRGVDLTACALRALASWRRHWLSEPSSLGRHHELDSLIQRIVTATTGGCEFLASAQREDGSFVSTLFGNEHQADENNPVIGTANVLIMSADLDQLQSDMARRASAWMLTAQHAVGGWGPPRVPLDYSGAYRAGVRTWRENEALAQNCSVEETALAVSALFPLAVSDAAYARAVGKGLAWLAAAIEQDRHHTPAILGWCFNRLWYHERLYPLVFAAGALSRVVKQTAPERPAALTLSHDR
jgi:squalene-hopene/tetraprenyl-beta-curcumene cyclase